MKKAYTKPLIAMESFQLNAAVAASCSSQDFIPIGRNENGCGFDEITDNYWNFFNGENCEFNLSDGDHDDPNSTNCYHGPMEAGTTFIAS